MSRRGPDTVSESVNAPAAAPTVCQGLPAPARANRPNIRVINDEFDKSRIFGPLHSSINSQ
jgi:hypothetical protein